MVHLVPRIPPASDGVGDYAAALAEGLGGAGIDSGFLVADPDLRATGLPTSVTRIQERRASALVRSLAQVSCSESGEPVPLLVHYANYGYENRGCPHWLVDGLLEWRRQSGGRSPLVSFFHEVYATGAPWQSSFWLSPLQRRLAAALALASDRVITSLDLYRGLLARWVPAAAIDVLPVFSTVGEVLAPVPLAARRRRLIVFGGAGGRARVYFEHRKRLAAACVALGIEEIRDIGPATSGGGGVAVAIEGVPVRRMGELPGDQVSALMAESLAGFVTHRPAFLGKSTVFAAYCAHGMLPVAAARDSDEPRLWAPSHDANGARNAKPTDGAALQACADAAAAWYAEHSIARQVAVFQRLLAELAGGQA